MKNRKRIIMAFVLVACMLIGVGYAAVTNVLDIQGSSTVSQTAAEDEFNEDIYFVGAKEPKTGTFIQSFLVKNAANEYDTVRDPNTTYLYSANINANNPDKGQFTINNLSDKDDVQAITYQIRNDSDHVATVTLKTITNTNGTTEGGSGTGDFDFDFYFGTVGTKTTTIPAHGTAEVTIVVTLRNQVTSSVSASYILELNATAGA